MATEEAVVVATTEVIMDRETTTRIKVQWETGLRVLMIEDMAIGKEEAINNSNSSRGLTTVHQ